jgi:hypothetical protein
MDNLLLEKIEYKIKETKHGVTKSFMYPNGQLFSEFTSNKKIGSWPLIHITRGKNPETGKIAIGQYALGQIGFGKYVFSQTRQDPQAHEFFEPLLDFLGIKVSGISNPL